ncbi:MAG: hypothetical protein ACRYG8_49405, partial [Janthinobacterium lividum]
ADPSRRSGAQPLPPSSHLTCQCSNAANIGTVGLWRIRKNRQEAFTNPCCRSGVPGIWADRRVYSTLLSRIFEKR